MIKVIEGRRLLLGVRLGADIIRFPISKVREIKTVPDQEGVCIVELFNGHEYMVDESEQDVTRWKKAYFDEKEAEIGSRMKRF